jgi:hypothetical protein
MNPAIPESDWREFKRVHQLLLERFCQRTLDELAALLQAKEGSTHDRYLRVYKLVERRDEEVARAFDDFRRSTAVLQLVVMRGMGLLADEDLKGFSERTRQTVLALDSY